MLIFFLHSVCLFIRAEYSPFHKWMNTFLSRCIRFIIPRVFCLFHSNKLYYKLSNSFTHFQQLSLFYSQWRFPSLTIKIFKSQSNKLEPFRTYAEPFLFHSQSYSFNTRTDYSRYAHVSNYFNRKRNSFAVNVVVFGLCNAISCTIRRWPIMVAATMYATPNETSVVENFDISGNIWRFAYRTINCNLGRSLFCQVQLSVLIILCCTLPNGWQSSNNFVKVSLLCSTNWDSWK